MAETVCGIEIKGDTAILITLRGKKNRFEKFGTPITKIALNDDKSRKMFIILNRQ